MTKINVNFPFEIIGIQYNNAPRLDLEDKHLWEGVCGQPEPYDELASNDNFPVPGELYIYTFFLLIILLTEVLGAMGDLKFTIYMCTQLAN